MDEWFYLVLQFTTLLLLLLLTTVKAVSKTLALIFKSPHPKECLGVHVQAKLLAAVSFLN